MPSSTNHPSYCIFEPSSDLDLIPVVRCSSNGCTTPLADDLDDLSHRLNDHYTPRIPLVCLPSYPPRCREQIKPIPKSLTRRSNRLVDAEVIFTIILFGVLTLHRACLLSDHAWFVKNGLTSLLPVMLIPRLVVVHRRCCLVLIHTVRRSFSRRSHLSFLEENYGTTSGRAWGVHPSADMDAMTAAYRCNAWFELLPLSSC